jgi:hypothetical protein
VTWARIQLSRRSGPFSLFLALSRSFSLSREWGHDLAAIRFQRGLLVTMHQMDRDLVDAQ